MRRICSRFLGLNLDPPYVRPVGNGRVLDVSHGFNKHRVERCVERYGIQVLWWVVPEPPIWSVYSKPVLIYGRNPVLEALRGGQVERLYAARGIEPRFARELEDEASKAGLELEWVARIEMDQVVQTTHHQGVVAEIADAEWSDLEDAFGLAESRAEQILLVLLDGITDPHNFGAIIRSAEVLGAHGVVVEERRSAPLSPTVVKTAAGATSYLPVVQVKNLPRLIDQLKERGVWVYGATGEASDTLSSLDCDRPLALVIGSEGDGLRRLVREKCDALAAIPTRGRVQSLNASVAAAILIYQAVSGRA